MTASIRLTPTGPEGLEDWGSIAPEHVSAGEARQRGWSAWEGDGLSVGVWACTPFEGVMGAYSVDEFMVLVEGEVILVEPDGRETVVTPGACFAIPKGLPVKWVQPKPVLKYYAILDRPGGEGNPLGRRVTVIDPAAPLSPLPPIPADMLLGPSPAVSGLEPDADPGKGWALGIWKVGPYCRRRMPFPRAELMHVLAGEAVVTGEDGRPETYGAGDTLFVAPGMVGDFRAAEGVAKVYCSVTTV